MGSTRLDDLLERTSRTFALSIPQLPDPTRDAVTVAYLLFRIADTFEDATRWSARAQQQALGELDALLDGPAEAAREAGRRWVGDPPLEHDGYVELLGETPAVIAALQALPPHAKDIIVRHLRRTLAGMARYVERAGDDHELQLRDEGELHDYCHVVAGIVGEMLTELYIADCRSLEDVADVLRPRAAAFGEGLQLTNILKDTDFDRGEGRSYLPRTLRREDVLAIAREDLGQAEIYVRALREGGAPAGLVAFNALPVMLAWATLERVENDGPGAKLTRPEVFALWQRMADALEADQPLEFHAPLRSLS